MCDLQWYLFFKVKFILKILESKPHPNPEYCWFSRDPTRLWNQNLLGLLDFYGHHEEEILQYIFSQVFIKKILFSVWNIAYWNFLDFSRRHQVTVVFKQILFRLGICNILIVQVSRKKFVCLLARKEKAVAFIEEVSDRRFLWFRPPFEVAITINGHDHIW